MPGIINKARCPVCGKFGSPRHPLNLCGRCEEQDKQPKCIISRCGDDAVVTGKIIGRYCKKHMNGEDRDHRRKGPETPLNDPKHGWRQEAPETYEIVREDFPITKR